MNTVPLTQHLIYSLVFFTHTFRCAVSPQFAGDPIFYSLNSPVLVAATSAVVLPSRVLRTSITSGHAGEFDWITRASRAFQHSGYLVNYTLSLSNADPAYRNKGRSAAPRRAGAKGGNERRPG